MIGEIAIIKIPPELSSKEQIIGEQILREMKSVKTVLKQDSNVKGEYRTRQVTFIAGEEKYETLYRESGLLFKVNVSTGLFFAQTVDRAFENKICGLRWRAHLQHVCRDWYFLSDNCEDEKLRS